jgi:membrane protein DedA with SNARE-associated domain
MWESLLSFVEEWGYWAVFFGAIIEGESIILTASFLASYGYLSFPKMMVVTFLGTLTADQALFFVGHYYGDRLIKKFPRLQGPADRAFRWIHRWDVYFILVFRFIYGIRIMSPVVIGASGLAPRRFAPLNLIAAVIWTGLSCSLGYFMGHAVQEVIENVDFFKKYFYLAILGVIVLVTVGVWGWRRYRAAIQSVEKSFSKSQPRKIK